jgi:hypothetical protein
VGLESVCGVTWCDRLEVLRRDGAAKSGLFLFPRSSRDSQSVLQLDLLFSCVANAVRIQRSVTADNAPHPLTHPSQPRIIGHRYGHRPACIDSGTVVPKKSTAPYSWCPMSSISCLIARSCGFPCPAVYDVHRNDDCGFCFCSCHAAFPSIVDRSDQVRTFISHPSMSKPIIQ